VYNIISMRRIILNSLLIFTILCAALALPARDVHADSTVTTGDMINLMNGLRTGTFGLPALVESAALDSCAQWTAETMAAIQADNHLAFLGYSGATERCSSSFGFGGGKTVFVTENWAMHTSMTLSILAGYWSDSAHMLPATDPQYTYVGAGIASANGKTYYVLQAGSGDGETAPTSEVNGGGTSEGSATPVGTADNSQYMQPVITSTPSADGMIYHVVKYGQTMFDIALAYGITLNYLMQENNLTVNSTIYEGQKLVIKQAPTPTVTPTFTVTPIYPTRTPTVPIATHTPLPLLTPTPTPQPSLAQELPPFDRQTLGFLLVLLSAIGLAVLVFLTFFKPTKPTKTAQGVTEIKPTQPEAPQAAPMKKKAPRSAPTQETQAAVPPAKKKSTAKVETQAAAEPTAAKKKSPTKSVAKPAAESKPAVSVPPAESPAKKPRTTKKKTQD
jgi:LysM repeat protein